MPPGSEVHYFIGRIRGGDVAAISSIPEGAPPIALWNTYVWVDSADDTASKVRDAGGNVLMEPFDVMDAGRMAVFGDPEGAVFCVWQANRHRGARVVNEHGALNFNGLNTRNPEAAKPFYRAVFGWETLTLDGGAEMWTLPGYGDYLERDTPGLRKMVMDVGAPERFIDVVAAINPITDDMPDMPANWSVTFAVDDADGIAERAVELGGKVLAGPFDAPWVRMAVIADPQGATFMASKFVPENKDLLGSPDSTASAA
jgi:predicted enzyme related to lactoylglutathione lyase